MTATGTELGVHDGRLAPCLTLPNCISSQASPNDGGHYLPAIPYRGGNEEALDAVREVVMAMPRTRIITSDDGYLHAEFRTLIMRFVDDVEFVLDDHERVIHFRSSSRVGYYDLGVNRRRIKRISRALLRRSGRQG